jgi:CHASE3 domain sensor protein
MAQETLRIRKELESEEFLKNHVHDEQCGHKHEEVEEVIRGEKLAVLEEELKKYKHAQANVIEQINEQLEELRYTMADLREELQERKDEEPAIAPKKEEPTPEVGIYL